MDRRASPACKKEVVDKVRTKSLLDYVFRAVSDPARSGGFDVGTQAEARYAAAANA